MRRTPAVRMALPLLPLLLKMAPKAAQLAKPALRWGARWAPYYAAKYTLYRCSNSYGVHNVYRRVLEAARRKQLDVAQEAHLRTTLKAMIRLPDTANKRILEVDAFLWTWIHEESALLGFSYCGEVALPHSLYAEAQTLSRQGAQALCRSDDNEFAGFTIARDQYTVRTLCTSAHTCTRGRACATRRALRATRHVKRPALALPPH